VGKLSSGSGCQRFVSGFALLHPGMAPASQQGFGVGAQAICFCTVVAILDLPYIHSCIESTSTIFIAFIVLWYIASIPSFFRAFILKGYWIFQRLFMNLLR
jgi:hypothetical protein